MVISGLQPLEFTDCLLDSPEFRENLNRHEKELDKTSQQIKRIVKEVKDLLAAAKILSRAQRTLAKSLSEFNFECIGSTQTDDEQVIADSLKQFSKLISAIEDERDNMLDRAHDQIVGPLEEFRKVHIGGVKENKKKYDKKTAKFCQAQEKFLNISSKKPGTVVVEADASLGMLEREYLHESLSYVLRIQEVQERIKFEFVEILLGFISGWLVFYHLGHEVAEDAKEYMTDLQHKVQKTREGFDETRQIAEELKLKYMDSKMKPETEFTKQGYLYLMEKKAFTATWSKYYCTYTKQNKQFTMLQYNQQISGRTNQSPSEKLTLVSCTRRVSDFEKRFCFDLTFEQKPNIIYVFQALSEEDRKAWLNAMDGKEPTYLTPGKGASKEEEYILDDVGFAFVKKCIDILEKRGLEEEGLYRVSGVGTKINKVLKMGLDSKKTESERLAFFTDDQHNDVLESKTIASALKQYLRKLKEPLMTYRYFNGFLAAAKQEQHLQRISDIHALVYRLPKNHMEMLDMIIKHLKNVSLKSNKNKMSVFNLGVVFGPTLLKATEDSLAAVLEIKFNNLVIEILIENYELIFKNPPGKTSDYISRHSSLSPPLAVQRTNGGYRDSREMSRNSTYLPQPIRVVAKSHQTDPIMSSSLQNIPNGSIAIYQAKMGSSMGSNIGQPQIRRYYPQQSQQTQQHLQHQIYETKSSSSINQTLSPLMRDASLSSRELNNISSSNYLKTIGGPSSGSYHHNNHNNTSPSTSSSASPPTTINNNGNSGNNRDGIYQAQPIYHHRSNHYQRETTPTSGTTYVGRTSGGEARELYGTTTSSSLQHQQPPHHKLMHHNTMTSSDSNLSKATRHDFSLFDRIHSTSSSNESVCSSSSRDLNLSTSHQPSSHHIQHHQLHQSPSAHPHQPSYGTIGQTNSGSTKQLNNWNLDYVPQQSQSHQQPIYNELISSHNNNNNNNNNNNIPKKQQRNKELLRPKDYYQRDNWRVRTLYACLAENDGELSFEPNQIITNVRRSNEPGWLEGTLNGKSGLIPENYVEILN